MEEIAENGRKRLCGKGSCNGSWVDLTVDFGVKIDRLGNGTEYLGYGCVAGVDG